MPVAFSDNCNENVADKIQAHFTRIHAQRDAAFADYTLNAVFL